MFRRSRESRPWPSFLRDLLIRADASPEIGSGHVMRCLALAHAWQRAGGHADFITVCPHSDLQTVMDRAGVGVTVLDRADPGPAGF